MTDDSPERPATKNRRFEKNDNYIKFNLPSALKERVEQRAFETRRRPSEWVRLLVEKYFEDRDATLKSQNESLAASHAKLTRN